MAAQCGRLRHLQRWSVSSPLEVIHQAKGNVRKVPIRDLGFYTRIDFPVSFRCPDIAAVGSGIADFFPQCRPRDPVPVEGAQFGSDRARRTV